MQRRSTGRREPGRTSVSPDPNRVVRMVKETGGYGRTLSSRQSCSPTRQARGGRILLAFGGIWGLIPGAALAGQDSVALADRESVVQLTDSAHSRLETISFFLLVLLLSAVVVRWLWNRLAKDLSWLPRLSFGRSLAVVAVWGLLFLVVLTMIATTREAMTPGSWRTVGMLYQVAGPSAASPADAEGAAEGMPLGAADIVWTIAVGWIGFFAHTLPRVSVNAPAIVSGVVIFVLFTALVEGLGRWTLRGPSRTTGQPRRWHFRWTASIVIAVFLMFAVGYCAIGLARQTAWLLSSPRAGTVAIFGQARGTVPFSC
jgi:hypothetical protein